MSSENTLLPFFVIGGPTASGKSELAVRVAEQCDGEIIGADAFQVYAGLEILTAQPRVDLRARVPHHLIGSVPVGQPFDVAQYILLANERIADIRARGKVAIVCGGTGLYLRSLIRGLAAIPPADADLRAQLEMRPAEDLHRQLSELDPVSFAKIDLANPRRVIRALEVCLLTGKPFSSFRSEWEQPGGVGQGIYVSRERPEILRRITHRTAAMFAAGVEEEVRAVTEIGPTASQAIGFREIQGLLTGRLSKKDCVEAIELGTRQYAKRQMTWLRREPALEEVQLWPGTDEGALVARLAERARQNGSR
jgi:tRNA dimethylallyltransferase